ncbi:hypothetical protein SARC_02444 [Sphaeroforma arctica JP610]|uniref:Uncharacterized protein n=1 Tax=Sphaeroforma arctica JP610 TaxID=667725 RepID=A0A0L0G8I7_9EUKA|nr:hypothetical protein SARC_02444 [Sphaeroforma arctica JP610]KNC85352.1 hypothetical protein SARC_02444 [Sphaeroforma arctica JP610]|eukprot:XP_014159254.1 hypothetical protein SARC_02444 [Sphaeroforma arctica JP610]
MYACTILMYIVVCVRHNASAFSINNAISMNTINLPAAMKSGGDSYRIFGSDRFNAARVYTEPIAGDNVLVGWSGSNNVAYVRGLVAHDDGSYPVLLWDENYSEQINSIRVDGAIYTRLVSSTGGVVWNSLINIPNSMPNTFIVGDSRMTYGDGKYAASFHVQTFEGVDSDAYIYLHSTNGSQIANTESGDLNFGCSRSMSILLNYNPSLTVSEAFLPVCVTDCYPGTQGSNFSSKAIGGIYINKENRVIDVAGECSGNVGAELGGVAPDGQYWRMVFNSHQAEAPFGQTGYVTGNQDIEFVSIDNTRNIDGPVVWLTNTTDIQESDAGIARFIEPATNTVKFLVGWVEDDVFFKLGLYSSDGNLTESEGIEDVTQSAAWGNRDDPFRTLSSGGCGVD